MKRRGPWLARQLLRVLVPADDWAFVTADLDECYRLRQTRGRAAARTWYWWQVLRAVPERARSLVQATSQLFAPGPDGWWGDLRHALRSNRRRPSYAVSVVATLGLGLGGGAAILAVADGVWFKPLPFNRPQELVRLYEVDRSPVQGSVAGQVMFGSTTSDRQSRMSPPLVEDLRAAQLRSLTGVGAIAGGSLEWSDEGHSERLRSTLVPQDILDILGLRPVLGGGFSSDARHEVILSHGFWQRAFGGDLTVVGRNMVLNGTGYRIVGVLPDQLPYLSANPIWTPLVFEPSDLAEGMRGARYLEVIGRVAPGHTIAGAAAELDAFVSNLGRDHPNHSGWGATAVELRLDLVQPYRKVILVLLAAAAVFLLITAVNVAGLAAARHAEAAHERSIRAALGAGSPRLLRQTVVEGVLLGLAGALVAGTLAYWTLGPMTRLAPAEVPRLDHVALDARVVLVLVTVAVTVGALSSVMGHLMAGSRARSVMQGISAQRQRHRGRTLLLVTQISLVTVLLAGGSMLLDYFSSLAQSDLGFEPQGVSAAMVVLDQSSYQDEERRSQFYQQVLDRLSTRGHRAAVGTNPPVAGSTMRFGYRVPGSEEQHWAQYHSVSPDYFSVLGIELMEGRAFDNRDAEGEPVVVINEVVAREHFPSGDALGQLITVVSQARRVVGVVGATNHFGPDQDPGAELYVPLTQDPWLLGHVLVAGENLPATLLADVVRAVDPTTRAPVLEPFRAYLVSWFAPLRFQLIVIGVLSLVGTALGALGLYGLVSFIVSRRTREIGIRVALGAGRGLVAWDVLRGGLAIATAGVALGIMAALALRQVMESLVAGIDVGSLAAYLEVALVLGSVTVLACARPAYRASSVNPMEALREE